MSPLEILIAADALLDSPEKWTQGVYVKTISGLRPRVTEYIVPDAICFCALGAIRQVSGKGDTQPAAIILARVVSHAESVHQWNDAPGRTFPDVKAAFARAIELARREA